MSNFPSKSSENSRTIFQGRVQSVTGLPTMYVIPSSTNILVPVDVAGANPNFGNNPSKLYVYKGGVLQTGWAVDSTSVYLCTVSTAVVSGTVEVSFTALSGDVGYVDVVLSKAGESSLTTRVNYSKLYAGATGPTGLKGSTGETGVQGIQGPAGNDGGGMVIQRFYIEVENPGTPSISDNGGFLRLTYGSPHFLSLGERLHIFNTVFNEYGEVTSVVSSLIVDTDIAYQSGAKDVRSMRRFVQGDTYGVYGNNDQQVLDFRGIIPVGAKLQEMHFLQITGAFSLHLSSGPVQKPATDWNKYLSGVLLEGVYDIQSHVFSSITESFIVLTADPLRNIFFNGTPYYTAWDTGLSDAMYEFHVSYIAYP